MAIATTDIKKRLSGGATNTDPNASLGGVKSSTEMAPASANNLFDDVSGTESAAGDIEYRCLYLHNAHATLTLQNTVVWIGANTPSPGSDVAIGLDPAGVGDGSTTGVAVTVADEGTAPTGVAFSAAPDEANGLTVGDIPPGESIAIWIRRTITAGAAAYNNDSMTLNWSGDTAA